MARIGARVHDDFNLIRWFSLTTLASVVTVSAVAAWALANFLTDRMIRQDAEITAGFVRSIVATENAYDFFSGATSAGTQPFQDFLGHVNRIPGVLRINVYSADRRMVWSSDASLMGKRFEHNEELDEALSADLVVHSGVVDPSHLVKSEHQHLGDGHKQFVESYAPIFDVHGRRIVGVVELYKVPADLFETLAEGRRLIWLAAVVAAAFLYAALFWIVLRAQRIIEIQGDRLVESESLAVVGEMGSAVAHGLRNPLAAIRSSAELALESPLPDQARECAQDIVAQVDRLEGWVRQLLTPAEAGRVFKPFYTTKPKGLGLGLPLVRRLVERFGGSVELESAPGKGTLVRLHLPVWE